jgi:hypothetical protein
VSSREREREGPTGKKGKGGQGIGRKGGGGRRGVQVQAPGVLLIGQGSKRWRWVGQRASTQLLSVLNEEDKKIL